MKATEKVRPWAVSGEADETIKEVATDALKPMLASIGISMGAVVSFDAPKAIADKMKADRKTNGKARLEGEGDADDNTRRSMVVNAVGAEFGTYAAQVRESAEKAMTGKPAKVKLEQAKLQAIIDKRIKPIRADVLNSVGDEALVTAAGDKFGPMLKSITVKDLKIATFEPEPNFATIAKAKRDESAQVLRAQADLAADLKTYAAESAKAGRQPTKSVVQAIISKHAAKFGALDAEEIDLLMVGAVANGLGTQLKDVKIEGGVLTEFELAAVPVPSR